MIGFGRLRVARLLALPVGVELCGYGRGLRGLSGFLGKSLALRRRAVMDGLRPCISGETGEANENRAGGCEWPAIAAGILEQDVERGVAASVDGFAGEIALKIAGQIACRLVAAGRLLSEAAQDDGLEIRVDRANECAWTRRAGGRDTGDGFRHGPGGDVRQRARQRLVQRNAERVDIGAQI